MSWLKDQEIKRTQGPEDQRTRDKGAKTPGDQGPEDQGTRGPQNQGTNTGAQYVSQDPRFFPRELRIFFQYHPAFNVPRSCFKCHQMPAFFGEILHKFPGISMPVTVYTQLRQIVIPHGALRILQMLQGPRACLLCNARGTAKATLRNET